MRSLPILAAAAALWVAAPAWAATDYFLHIDTIEGESTSDKHRNWIDVDSWAWGVSSVAGKAVFDPFSWQQGLDRSVVPLFLGVATGKHFKDATLDVVKAGADPQSFFQMVFGDVLLTSLKLNGGATQSAAGALMYDRVTLRYRPQDDKGAFGAWVEGGFDLKAGKILFSGNPLVIEGLLLAGGDVALDIGPVGAVPEPAEWALLSLGLLAVAGAVRWRKAA